MGQKHYGFLAGLRREPLRMHEIVLRMGRRNRRSEPQHPLVQPEIANGLVPEELLAGRNRKLVELGNVVLRTIPIFGIASGARPVMNPIETPFEFSNYP